MLELKITSLLCFLILGPFIGGLLDGLDRKITARFQGRKGPPLLQPFYDVAKLFMKQTVGVNDVQNLFVFGYLIFVMFTGGLFFFGGDILLVFFALTLAEIYYIMAACSSNSPYSSMGAQRELLQIVAYEPMMLLVAIGFYMSSGSFYITDIMRTPAPAIIDMPGIFLGFIFILTIKFRKSPFDLSTSHHAHQEMVKGSTVEFSGRVLAATEVAHWYQNVFLFGVLTLFFLCTSPISLLFGLSACAIAYFFEIFIDNTFARMKWQIMLKSSWIIAVVLGMLNVFILNYIR